MWSQRRLHRAARHVLFFGLFGQALPAGERARALRDASTAWAVAGADDALEGIPTPPEPAIAEALDRCRAAIRQAAATDGDPLVAFRAVSGAAYALCRATVPRGLVDRVGWAIELAWDYARQLTLSVASTLLIAWLLGTNAPVRSVMTESRAGLIAFGALSAVCVTVMLRVRALGRLAFWHPLALPPTEDAPAPYAPSVASRALAFTLLAALGVAIVVMAGVGMVFGTLDAAYRSPFLLAAHFGVFFLAAHALDVWDYFDPRPVRITGAALAVVAIWFSLGRAPDEHWVSTAAPRATRWVEPREFPRAGEGPVVMVALSGGGSRAAIFGAGALMALERDVHEVARATHVLSAVSGGSLAAAGYLAWRTGRVDTPGYERAMSADYVWPLLRAAFTPETRAESVVSSWRELLHAGDLSLAALPDLYRGPRALPLTVFNAADIQGHAVTLSPFTAGALDGADDRTPCKESRALEDAWVCDRDVAHDLQSVLPGVDLPLLSAVRASANFPLAFPLVPIRTSVPLTGHEQFGDLYHTRITDGGVFLNSGVLPLYRLALSRREEILRRGLLLVIVDAGATRTYSGLSGEWDILSALKRAEVGRTQLLHRTMLARLAATFRGRFSCVRIDPEPSSFSRIPTSWYLGAPEQETVRGHFRTPRWASQRDALRGAFESAARGDGEPWDDSCLARPPLG